MKITHSTSRQSCQLHSPSASLAPSTTGIQETSVKNDHCKSQATEAQTQTL